MVSDRPTPVFYAAIARLDAELDDLSLDGDVRDVETEIVTQSREPITEELKQRIVETLNEALSPFGQHVKLAVLESRGSIAVYFVCSSPEGLHRLRCLWRREQLRNIIEAVFTLLSIIQPITVKNFVWAENNYEACIKYFCDLACTFVHTLQHIVETYFMLFFVIVGRVVRPWPWPWPRGQIFWPWP